MKIDCNLAELKTLQIIKPQQLTIEHVLQSAINIYHLYIKVIIK